MSQHHPYLEVLPEAGWPVAPDKRVLSKPPCGGRRKAQRARQLGRRGGLQRRHRTCRRLGVAVGGGHRRRRARRFRRRRRCRRRCRRHRRRWRRRAVGRWRAAAAEAGDAIDDAVGAHHRAWSDGRPAEATSGGCKQVSEKEGGWGGGRGVRGGGRGVGLGGKKGRGGAGRRIRTRGASDRTPPAGTAAAGGAAPDVRGSQAEGAQSPRQNHCTGRGGRVVPDAAAVQFARHTTLLVGHMCTWRGK